MHSGIRQDGVGFPLWHFPALWPWTRLLKAHRDSVFSREHLVCVKLQLSAGHRGGWAVATTVTTNYHLVIVVTFFPLPFSLKFMNVLNLEKCKKVTPSLGWPCQWS